MTTESTEPTEPHANIFRLGTCLVCGEGDWNIIAIPELSTGLQHPIAGGCDACGHKIDMTDLPPFQVEQS